MPTPTKDKLKTADDRFFARLHDSRLDSYRKLESFRKADRLLKQQIAGHMYGGEMDDKDKVIVLNQMFQMIWIYDRVLASAQPQVMIETDYPDLLPMANSFQLALNRLLTEIDMQEVMSKVVMDAIVSCGVLKIGRGAGNELYEIDGYLYDPGQVFCEAVDVNDWVVDMQAKSSKRIDYMGDRFRMPRQWIAEQYGADEQVLANSDDRGNSEYQPEGRLDGDEDADKRLYDEAWIWNIWIPKENQIIVMADDDEKPLDILPYEGPEGGPYEWLRYIELSGHVMPISIGQQLYEMHKFINQLMRKQARQGNRQKDILLYEENAADDAQSLKRADDGDMIAVKDVNQFLQVKYGGGDPQNFNMLIWTIQQYGLKAGNLDAVAGLAPQSETLGQDEMLKSSASAMMDSMSAKTVNFMERVIKKLAWYEWTDELRSRELQYRPDYVDLSIPVEFTPEEREGDFLDYNFRIHPHSLRKRTPSERLAEVMGLWERFIMPSAELSMQQGLVPNVERIAKYVSELSQLPFDMLYATMNQELEQKAGQQPMPPRMANNTTRTYKRISEPGQSARGNDIALMQANMGVSPQQGLANVRSA